MGGGGGIMLFGGPYWIIGRYIGCGGAGVNAGRGLGSLTTHIVASKE